MWRGGKGGRAGWKMWEEEEVERNQAQGQGANQGDKRSLKAKPQEPHEEINKNQRQPVTCQEAETQENTSTHAILNVLLKVLQPPASNHGPRAQAEERSDHQIPAGGLKRPVPWPSQTHRGLQAGARRKRRAPQGGGKADGGSWTKGQRKGGQETESRDCVEAPRFCPATHLFPVPRLGEH